MEPEIITDLDQPGELEMGHHEQVVSTTTLDAARQTLRDWIMEAEGRFKLTPDRAGYMAHPDWVSSPAARVPEAIWRPEIPTRDGLKATAAWYRENRWL